MTWVPASLFFGREEGIGGCKNETLRVHDSPHLGIACNDSEDQLVLLTVNHSNHQLTARLHSS